MFDSQSTRCKHFKIVYFNFTLKYAFNTLGTGKWEQQKEIEWRLTWFVQQSNSLRSKSPDVLSCSPPSEISIPVLKQGAKKSFLIKTKKWRFIVVPVFRHITNNSKFATKKRQETFFQSPPQWEYIKTISMLFLPDNLGKCVPVEADADNLGKCTSISVEVDAENLATMDM